MIASRGLLGDRRDREEEEVGMGQGDTRKLVWVVGCIVVGGLLLRVVLLRMGG